MRNADDAYRRLNALSRDAAAESAPHGFEWPDSVEIDAWHFCEELLSLRGTAAYDALTEAQRRRLSFFENANFFSLNIHGERALLAGLAARLYQDEPPHVTEYLQHFLDEENRHLVYFGTFCRRYAGKIYPDRHVAFPREHAPGEEELLFFARVLIFEEIVDIYNREVAADERVHPLTRQIHRMHHDDEVRHLAFGRLYVEQLFEAHRPRWSDEVVARIRRDLEAYLRATLREYVNADVYADAGLQEPFRLAREAWESEAATELRRRMSRRPVSYLQSLGLSLEVP